MEDFIKALEEERAKFMRYQCPSFAEREYNIALEKYYIDMMEYKKLNWFKKLFKEKPVKPIIDWFMFY